MKIHGMLLVRNEQGRWLEQVLYQLKQVCHRVVVLDDNSEDDTPKICENYGCETYHGTENLWIADELKVRMQLWNITTLQAKNNDWVICLDADELFVNDHLPYLKYILNVMPPDIDGIGFRLYDMWSDTHYRDDNLWQAHRHIWPMIVRYKEGCNYQWHNKKLHCGRFPANSSQKCYPTMIPIKHMGWSRELDRIKKYVRYMETDPEGKEGILAQYHSIIDKSPNIKLFGGCY